MMRILIGRFGLDTDNLWVLEVAGRVSGRRRATPVKVLTVDKQRFIVSLYGDGQWARNVRAAHAVTLRKGRQVRTLKPVEVGGNKRLEVIGAYLAGASRKETMDLLRDANAEAVPVFRLDDLYRE
jgi:deazaflavin-dependent oxidoreductase (nitroreductase family)